MTPSVGLIGYGRFGRLAARYVARGTDVIVYDTRRSAPATPGKRIRQGTLAQAAAQPVVVLAVPVSALRRTLRRIRVHLAPGALVVDVCAVKVLPVRWMMEILPPSVSVLGTHPLFGPESDTGTLRGQRIVICPARITPGRLRSLRNTAIRKGLRVHLMSPRQHDRLMAETLLASQYAGRLIAAAHVRRHAWSTGSYEHLKALVSIAESDSLQLFQDMMHYNPYGPGMVRALGKAHRTISRAPAAGTR
jgi:prephenate dehydrogenase